MEMEIFGKNFFGKFWKWEKMGKEEFGNFFGNFWEWKKIPELEKFPAAPSTPLRSDLQPRPPYGIFPPLFGL